MGGGEFKTMKEIKLPGKERKRDSVGGEKLYMQISSN